MELSAAVIDIFLQPGEIFFGDKDTRIRTILGSCVAITLWHPQLRIGGMCHFMLPARRPGKKVEALDGRYADEAMLLLLKEVVRAGTNPYQYEVKLFGGGNMFAPREQKKQMSVADRNIEAGRALVKQHGFTALVEHLGGRGHRQIIFEVGSGDVWVRQHVLVDTPPKPQK
jgi:chemotaxis protein CheD